MPQDWSLPAVTPVSSAWFTSATLALQHCAACGVRQHPPEEICHSCGGMDFDYRAVAPTGTVYSYTVAHYAVNRALADHVPYAVVLVSLDDAPEVRVIGNIVGIDPAEVHIGMAVRALWERHEVDGDVVELPLWEPA
ncbi:MAG: OB-fold domain-containing protein [Acidimicrobiia bacterium]|nr:OB-fold domain-containing protein [Acidimicrobiia bacterium]